MTRGPAPASRDRSASGILLRPGIAWLALFFSLAWHPALAADAVRVVVIVDQEQAVYWQLIDGIERELRRNGDSKATLSVHDLSRRESGGAEPALPAAGSTSRPARMPRPGWRASWTGPRSSASSFRASSFSSSRTGAVAPAPPSFSTSRSSDSST